MTANKRLYAVLLATLTALVLMFTLSMPAFAEDGETEPVTIEETESTTEAATETDTETDAESATATETTTETTASTSTSTETETEAAKTTGLDTTAWIINLIVAGLVVIAIVVLCVVFRNKIPGWWKALKSECKKIVWCPKDKLKKNAFVVVILIIILTVVIALLDFAFSGALGLLRDLFK